MSTTTRPAPAPRAWAAPGPQSQATTTGGPGGPPRPHYGRSRPGEGPRRGRPRLRAAGLLLLSLLATGALKPSAALHGRGSDAPGAKPPPAPPSGGDISISAVLGIPDPKTKQVTVFMADRGRGGIYFATADPAESPTIGLDKFTKLEVTLAQADGVARTAPLDLKDPVALAYHNGRLLVCDKHANTVYEVDLGQRTAGVLLSPSQVKTPVSVAVSESGIIAVGQDASDNVLILRRGERIQLPAVMDDPSRLVFTGQDLLIMEAEKGKLYWLRDVEGGSIESLRRQLSGDASSKRSEAMLPPSMTSRVRGITDFVVAGDIFIVADGDHIVAFTPGRGLSSPGAGGLTYQLSTIKSARQNEEQIAATLKRPTESNLSNAVDPNIVERSTVNLGFRPFVFKGMNTMVPSKLATAGSVLITWDERLHVIRLMNLVSGTVKLTGTDVESEEALVSLYEDLLKGDALPLREYVAPAEDDSSRDSRTLEQVLLNENIINTPHPSRARARAAAAKAAGPPKLNPRQRLAALVCSLNNKNKWSCGNSPEELDVVLRRPIKQGYGLVLPNVFVSTVNSQRAVNLGGRQVGDHLSDMSPTEGGPRPTAEYLMRINPAYSRSFEHEMTKRGYTVATPDGSALAPGALVRLNHKQEVVAGALGEDCLAAAGLKVASRKAGFIPTVIFSRGWADYLPRAKGQPIRYEELAKLGVAKMEMRLFDPFEEALVPAGKSASPDAGSEQAQPVGQCAVPASEGQYLINMALRVSGVSYRLLRADNTPVSLKAGDLARYGIRGVLGTGPAKPGQAGDGAEGGEFINVTGTEYLSYRAVVYHGWKGPDPSAGTAPQTADQGAGKDVSAGAKLEVGAPVPPELVKPGGPQDVFSIKEGIFVLPQVHWKADLILNVISSTLGPTLDLPETRLLSTGNNLLQRNLIASTSRRRHPKVIDLETYGATLGGAAEPKTRPHQSSASVPAPPREQAPTIAEVLSNRRMLREAINFPPEEDPERARAKNFTIGVMEDQGATNTEHPDFVWLPDNDEFAPAENGGVFESAWLEGEPSSDNLLRRRKFTNPDLTSPFQMAGEEVTRSTHGTHVGGVLASSHRSSAPGLALGSQLLLIDVSNLRSDKSVTSRIQAASSTDDIRVFNISQALPKTETYNLGPWQQGFGNKWRSRLFVLAASNDGKNYYYTDHGKPESFPLAIANQYPNILTVSSTDLSKKPLTKKEVVEGPVGRVERIVGDGANYGKNYVDLLAPGKGIFSAAADRAYSPGDGTSLAAPQVAAAAVLLQTLGLTAKVIKARLIYTADWDASYENLVWGGFLNVRRAWWEIGKDLYQIKERDGKISAVRTYDINVSSSHVRIVDPVGAYFYDPTDEDAVKDASIPETVPLSRILRIESLGGASNYRLIYRDKDNHVRIILNAALAGEFQYRNCDEWEEGTGFVKGKCGKARQETLSVSNIHDYVASTAKLGEEASLFFGKRNP